MKKLIIAIFATLAAATFATVPPAQADDTASEATTLPPVKVCQNRTFDNGSLRVECRTRDVKTKRLELIYSHPVSRGRVYAEFNNGTAWYFAPCVYEDSGRCHWNAGKRGNGRGTSFIRYGGKTFRLL